VGVAQLAELRPAGGSPDRGSEKYDDGLVPCSILVEAHFLAALVGQGKIGQPFADGGAGGVSCWKARPGGVFERGRCVESVVVAFYGHRQRIL